MMALQRVAPGLGVLISSGYGWARAALPLPAANRDERSEAASHVARLGARLWRRDWIILALLTLAALLVHGYHPGVEDSEIYLPGVEHALNPGLFPTGTEYFESHAHFSFFAPLIATSVRLSHLSLDWVAFLWHVLSIFLLLLACRRLSVLTFSDPVAQWAGVVLVASLLTLPIAGTDLYPMDQYLNPRNLTAFAQIFAIAAALERKYLRSILFLVLAASLHPFMACFALAYCILIAWTQKPFFRVRAAFLFAPFGIPLQAPTKAYDIIANSHSYHYLLRWHWYELIGAVAPIAGVWFYARWAKAKHLVNLEVACRALFFFGIIFLAAGVVIAIPASLESVARLQPMRSLFLIYLLFFLFGGALLGQYVLKRHVWRWAALFLPVCAAMHIPQRLLFPGSAHDEWPWAKPRNPWVQAFDWIRGNTPQDAIFALDPFYMHIKGEDENGFRAVAQRSRLADAVKDSGVVSMFPQLAEEWQKQVDAQSHWNQFQLSDFLRLRNEYGVTWVVLQQPGISGVACPYENLAVKVCRLP